MNIKRTSWHYKISMFGEHFEGCNDNLCYYFWRVVGKVAFTAFILFVIGMFCFVYFTSPFIIANTIMIAFLLSVIILPICAVLGLRHIFGKPPEIPNENIIIEYIKAKKHDYCPLINYID